MSLASPDEFRGFDRCARFQTQPDSRIASDERFDDGGKRVIGLSMRRRDNEIPTSSIPRLPRKPPQVLGVEDNSLCYCKHLLPHSGQPDQALSAPDEYLDPELVLECSNVVANAWLRRKKRLSCL